MGAVSGVQTMMLVVTTEGNISHMTLHMSWRVEAAIRQLCCVHTFLLYTKCCTNEYVRVPQHGMHSVHVALICMFADV